MWDATRTTQLPRCWNFFFLPGEVLGLVNGAFADDHVRFLFQNGAHQLFNVRTAVLVVRIGVDDDVRTQPQTCVQSGEEAPCQTFVAAEGYDVVESQLPCLLNGAVLAAVVDDEIFDGVDAVDVPRQITVCQLQRFFLVVAGNLNNQFHSN